MKLNIGSWDKKYKNELNKVGTGEPSIKDTGKLHTHKHSQIVKEWKTGMSYKVRKSKRTEQKKKGMSKEL